MKIKIAIFCVSLLFIFAIKTTIASAITKVDTFRITFTSQSEKWTIINKNIIYWIDPEGIIRGFDTKRKKEFPLFKNGQPLNDLHAIISYDGRYLIYNRYDNVSYNVSVYDTVKKVNLNITDDAGSRFATDFDNNTIVYIDDGAYGDLYTYNIKSKNSTLIAQNAAVPRISGRYIVWYTNSGSYDIRAYDLIKKEMVDIPNPENASRSSPDIDNNKIVYIYQKDNINSVRLFDLNKKNEKILAESPFYSMSWPEISNKYVVWGKDTTQHVSGVEGTNLKTGEVFEIQEQGPHQNGNLSPIIDNNIVSWMAWRTGNGDIYGAILNK